MDKTHPVLFDRLKLLRNDLKLLKHVRTVLIDEVYSFPRTLKSYCDANGTALVVFLVPRHQRCSMAIGQGNGKRSRVIDNRWRS